MMLDPPCSPLFAPPLPLSQLPALLSLRMYWRLVALLPYMHAMRMHGARSTESHATNSKIGPEPPGPTNTHTHNVNAAQAHVHQRLVKALGPTRKVFTQSHRTAEKPLPCWCAAHCFPPLPSMGAQSQSNSPFPHAHPDFFVVVCRWLLDTPVRSSLSLSSPLPVFRNLVSARFENLRHIGRGRQIAKWPACRQSQSQIQRPFDV